MYGVHARVSAPAARFKHKNRQKYTRHSLLIHILEQGNLGMRLKVVKNLRW